jgi:hypothetical protein
MMAQDFNLAEEIRFDINRGLTTFKDSRLLIFDANSFGLLRQYIVDLLGMDKAREFFLRFGYQNGFTDFMQMKVNYKFDSEKELLASGPVIHTWEGIVKATPKKLSFDREKGEFYFTGIWANSYEAEQHLSFNHHSSEPVCWTLMGYASGWCTGFFGEPVLCIEPKCVGKGDDNCEWEIKPINEWGNVAEPYFKALENFWKEK